MFAEQFIAEKMASKPWYYDGYYSIEESTGEHTEADTLRRVREGTYSL